MYGAMKRHEVHVLKQAGLSIRETAEKTGVSPSTVKRVLNEAPVQTPDDGAVAKARGVGRPSRVEAFRKSVQEILTQEPELPTVEILHRVRLAGYEGGKTALYELVGALRPNRTTPVVRFEGIPGEFSQHDFGQVTVRYVDGSRESLHMYLHRQAAPSLLPAKA
jgi:transposase